MTRTREHKFLTLFFDIAMFFFGIFSLLHFWMKSKQAADRKKLFRERFGLSSALEKRGNPVIWVHAVSVGEVAAVKKFVEGIRENFPAASIVVSTVTPTGQAVAESLRGIGCHLIYFPFDFSFITRRVLRQIKPDLILLAETEIWPNFILRAKELGIPVGIINGRISSKSLSGYRKAAFLLKPVFQSLDFLLVQTEDDKKRYVQLGIHESKVHALGNMKFDQTEIQFAESSLKRQLGFNNQDEILIGGSTHPGEEEILFGLLRNLQRDFPDLKMIVAPRHPERAKEVGEKAREFGFEPKYFSLPAGRIESNEVLIVDRVGELKRLYSAAYLVVMGGSFIPHGGQNPIEPSAYASPVITGSSVSNFRAVYTLFESENAVRIVADAEELASEVRLFLKDKNLRETVGRNAKRVVENQRGATERHLNWVKDFYDSSLRGANATKQSRVVGNETGLLRTAFGIPRNDEENYYA